MCLGFIDGPTCNERSGNIVTFTSEDKTPQIHRTATRVFRGEGNLNLERPVLALDMERPGAGTGTSPNSSSLNRPRGGSRAAYSIPRRQRRARSVDQTKVGIPRTGTQGAISEAELLAG